MLLDDAVVDGDDDEALDSGNDDVGYQGLKRILSTLSVTMTTTICSYC